MPRIPRATLLNNYVELDLRLDSLREELAAINSEYEEGRLGFDQLISEDLPGNVSEEEAAYVERMMQQWRTRWLRLSGACLDVIRRVERQRDAVDVLLVDSYRREMARVEYIRPRGMGRAMFPGFPVRVFR